MASGVVGDRRRDVRRSAAALSNTPQVPRGQTRLNLKRRLPVLVKSVTIMNVTEATPWKAKEIDCLGAVSWFFPDSIARARILSPDPGGPWISVVALHDQKVPLFDNRIKRIDESH